MRKAAPRESHEFEARCVFYVRTFIKGGSRSVARATRPASPPDVFASGGEEEARAMRAALASQVASQSTLHECEVRARGPHAILGASTVLHPKMQ